MSAKNSDPVQSGTATPASASPGSTLTWSTLTSRQQQLLAAACQQIEADPHFRQLGAATFQRAEVTPGLDETAPGYLYLRYDVPGSTPQEFWAHVSAVSRLRWKTGQVSVPLN